MIRPLLDKLLATLLWVILAAMAVVVAANVFCRFVLDSALSWGDETAQILLVWLTFLGAALAVRDQEHYSLHYLSRKLTGRRLAALLMVRDLLVLAAIVVLLWYSTIVTVRMSDWIMPATEISRALVYGACPVGCAAMLYYAVVRLASRGRGAEPPTPTDPDGQEAGAAG